MHPKRPQLRRRHLALLLTVLLVPIGCTQSPQQEEPPIAVSVTPQAWLVRQIAGASYPVETLVPPGASPATYQVDDAQMTRVLRCSAYIRIGVPFEDGPWFNAIAGEDSIDLYDARDAVTTRVLEAHNCDHDHDHGHHHHAPGPDPHLWTSPRNLAQMALQCRTILDEIDPHPERMAERERRLNELLSELEALEGELRAQLKPLEGSSFLVFHPAWGYFADEYGLTQIAIEIDGKSPSDAELTAFAEQARAEQISVVLVQPQFEGTSARAVADAIGGRVVEVDPLEVPGSLRELATVLVEARPVASP